MTRARLVASVAAIAGVAFSVLGGSCVPPGPVPACENDPTDPDFFVHGLCFSPYKDGQSPPGQISVEQIQQRLCCISRKQHTGWVRTYSATSGLENLPREAKSLGYKVAMGTWIRSDTKNRELDNLVWAARNDWINIAVVGNEEVFAGAMSAEDLAAEVGNTRARLAAIGRADIHVTTPEPFGTLFARAGDGNLTNRAVIEAVDVVFVAIYPFHDGVHIDDAANQLASLYYEAVAAVNEVSPGKKVVIAETGWPSAGETKGKAVPSPENAVRYFLDAAAWATENGVDLFYFEAFDESWKGPEESERHWGIWGTNCVLKFPADRPLRGVFLSTPSVLPD